MDRGIRRRIGTLLLLLAVLLGAAPVHAQSKRQAKEAELAQLRQRISALRHEMAQVRGRFDTLRGQLRHTEQRIGHLSRRLNTLNGQLKQQSAQLSSLERRQSQLHASVRTQRRHLAAQIRAAYAMGRQQVVKMLLNQENPAAVGRVMTYYDYLNHARSERIGRLRKTLDELAAVRQRIAAKTEALQTTRKQKLAQLGQLQQSRKRRRAVVAKLKSELSSKGVRLKQMLADQARLESLIKALAKALSDIPAEPGNRKPFHTQRGKLKWPARGRVVVHYGSRRAGDVRWKGVLIQAPAGRKVHAVSYGRVAFADWLRGYGLLIIIDHGDGYMTLYGHNQSLYKEVGDWVEAGEVIASVGDSGGSDRDALYFEIRKNGRPANPARWCRGSPRRTAWAGK